MRKFEWIWLFLFLLSISLNSQAQRLSHSQLSPMQTGEIILQLAEAIESPLPTEKNLQTIHQFGTDTRFYILTRGWLMQYLEMTSAMLQNSQSPSQIEALKKRQAFLHKAIRLIDLE